MQVIKGRKNKKLRAVFLRIVLLIAVVFVAFSLIRLLEQVAENNQTLAKLDADLAAAQTLVNKYGDQLSDKDQLMQDAAREDGYVSPDETVVVVVPNS